MRRILIAFLIAFLLGACAAEETPAPTPSKKQAAPPPTAAEAQTLIANAPEFGEYQFTDAGYSLPTTLNEPARATAKELDEAGWIAIDGDTVSLTDKSRNDKRFLMRANGILDIVPLAKKEMGSVLAVREQGNEVAVDFQWKWMPNEVGAAFESGPVAERFAKQHEATATLMFDGTNWVILKLEPR